MMICFYILPPTAHTMRSPFLSPYSIIHSSTHPLIHHDSFKVQTNILPPKRG